MKMLINGQLDLMRLLGFITEAGTTAGNLAAGAVYAMTNRGSGSEFILVAFSQVYSLYVSGKARIVLVGIPNRFESAASSLSHSVKLVP